MDPSNDDDPSLYGTFLKPRVAEVLRAVGLDVSYERADGDQLYFRNGAGEHVAVLDMLGGYGASLLGHNHPALVARAMEVLLQRRPFNAQASLREPAGALAERLSKIVGASTGRSYVATFATTGADAVEAAIKHAEMALTQHIDTLLAQNARVERDFRVRQRKGRALAPPGVLAKAAEVLVVDPPRDADDLFTRVVAHNLQVFEGEPTLLTLQRAFHGKSTGALSLTANPRYRKAWRRIGLRSVFLAPDDVDALEREIELAQVRYVVLSLDFEGRLDIDVRSLANIIGCFVEPIQGEGGVREIPASFLRALRQRADAAGFPLVFDEIQCGMGRTGTFLASEPAKVRAEYYLLSKSLGGGLSKISALLVERERYIGEFGLLHTSTFAEDDFSSTIALRGLDLLTANDGALMRDCKAKGAYLVGRLEELRRKYPDQIRDVRGRGLMLGLEFEPQATSPSPFLRVAWEQELLGYLIAGHLLHAHQIRIAPTLSSPETLRIQPSALVSIEALDRFCDAIESVASALRAGDALAFVRHLVARQATSRPDRSSRSPVSEEASRRVPFISRFFDAAERVRNVLGTRDASGKHLARDQDERVSRGRIVVAPPSSPRLFTAATSKLEPSASADGDPVGPKRSVTFLAHFLEPGDLRSWDSSLGSLSDEQCASLLDRTRETLEPFVTHRSVVRSATGQSVDLTVVAIPFTSEQVMRTFRASDRDDAGWVREQIEKGVELAREERSAVIGFGGFTSIVTRNCRDVLEASAILTSGNSVTAAAAVDATVASIERMGLSRVELGIVGAVGNIGTVLAEALVAHAHSVVLVGRSNARPRLLQRANRLYASAWQEAEAGVRGGIPERLANSLAVRAAASSSGDEGTSPLGERLRRAMEQEVGEEHAPIRVATDMAALTHCNVIVSATNSPEHVILPAHVHDGPVILCDVATPGDVAPSILSARPSAVLLKGGIVRLPLGQELEIDGMQLPAGQIYGCLAETVLLGLSGASESLSLGALSVGGLRSARDLAHAHGFEFTRRRLIRVTDGHG